MNPPTRKPPPAPSRRVLTVAALGAVIAFTIPARSVAASETVPAAVPVT